MKVDVGDLAEHYRQRIEEAIESLQDEEEPHPTPSPSGIYSCIRQQWGIGKRLPRTNRLSAESIKNMESGKVIESFWREALNRAGIMATDLGERVTVNDVMSGEPDVLAVDTNPPKILSIDGVPVTLLAELKDLGMWSWLSILDDGLKVGTPDYYYQVQCYLKALGLPFALLIAGKKDPSAVTWVWQRIKRREGRPPKFIVEVVPFAPADFAWADQRSRTVHHLIENEENIARVPTEYEGRFLKPREIMANEKKSPWPCGWCPILEQCLEVG